MNPFAAAFATIVSLTADFVGSRRADESQTLDAYVDWLRRNEHANLAERIDGNAELSRSLQTLLIGNHEAVLSKLEELDAVFSSVAQNLSDFADIAAAIRPESLLTEQCLSVLKQLHDADASFFIESRTNRGTPYPHFNIVDGQRGELQLSEPKFIKADIDVLCALNLLTPEAWGANMSWRLTRAGDKLGSSLET